jgi:hypothetical protein
VTVYHLEDTQGNGGELATTLGWGEFSRWASRNLQIGGYVPVWELIEHGVTEPALPLRKAVARALAEKLFDDRDVEKTAENLLALLEEIPDGEPVYVVASPLGGDGADPGDEDDGAAGPGEV